MEDPEMEPASDMDKQTSVDESQVIGLIRHLLPVASGADEPSTQKTREQAGTLLWDLSTIGPVAELMVQQGMILDVMEAIIPIEVSQESNREALDPPTHTDPGRPLEVLFGILGNLAAHSDIAVLLAQRHALLDCVTLQALHSVGSSAALGELCRLATTALCKSGSYQWYTRLSGPLELERVLWIAQRTQDPVTHTRALDLVVAILHAQVTHTDQHTDTTDHTQTGPEGGAGGGGMDTDTHTDTTAITDSAQCLVQLGLLTLVTDELNCAANQMSHHDMDEGPSWGHVDMTPRSTGHTHATHTAAGQHTRNHAHARVPHTPTNAHARTPRLTGSASTGALAAMGDAAAPPPQAAPPAAGTNEPSPSSLPVHTHASDMTHAASVLSLPTSEASVDCALRVIEELGALCEGHSAREAMQGEGGLGRGAVRLLHCEPSEQVLASLLVALQCLGPCAVRALSSSLTHTQALLECMGELPSGERGAWQRELVLYLLAQSLQLMAQTHTHSPPPTHTHTHNTHTHTNGTTATAPCGLSDLLSVSERVVSLHHHGCGIEGTHVTGYIRAGARSVLSLLEPEESALVQADIQAHAAHHHHPQVQHSGAHVGVGVQTPQETHKLRMRVQKVCLELKELLV